MFIRWHKCWRSLTQSVAGARLCRVTTFYTNILSAEVLKMNNVTRHSRAPATLEVRGREPRSQRVPRSQRGKGGGAVAPAGPAGHIFD